MITGAAAPSYAIQCAIYARAQTGVRLYGDAGAWWGEAAGRYLRGQEPTRGAILVFKPSRFIRLGHVAVVSRVVSRREILVDQANWVHGRINHDMSVIDASPANDWTVVRVEDLGSGTHGRENPTFGFVYPPDAVPAIEVARGDRAPNPNLAGPHLAATRLAAADPRRDRVPVGRAMRVASTESRTAETGRGRLARRRYRAERRERVAEADTRKTAERLHLAALRGHVRPNERHDARFAVVVGHLRLAAAEPRDRVVGRDAAARHARPSSLARARHERITAAKRRLADARLEKGRLAKAEKTRLAKTRLAKTRVATKRVVRRARTVRVAKVAHPAERLHLAAVIAPRPALKPRAPAIVPSHARGRVAPVPHGKLRHRSSAFVF